MAKQARKVALINVADYPRDKFTVHWHIVVDGEEGLGYRWQATISAYKPIAWEFQGNRTTERPDVALPQYPADIPVKQHEYLQMTTEEQQTVRDLQEARRELCSQIFEAHPKPVYQVDERIGVTTTRDEADTAAQQWVLEQMAKLEFKVPEKSVNPQSGYAMVGVFTGGWIIDALFESLRRLLSPLTFALAYAVATRSSRMNLIRDAIDAGVGAGLWRIYDGTRPATCGTATTLLAEMTCSDPCAAAASSGVLTFSAITADAAANATGTATWSRIVDSTGTCAVDMNVGTSGSDLNLNSTAIAVGQEVSITSAVITEGNP